MKILAIVIAKTSIHVNAGAIGDQEGGSIQAHQ